MTEPKKYFGLTRRDFLESMAVGLPVGWAIGTGLGNLLVRALENSMENGESINLNELLTEEHFNLLNEIGEFRESLGLRGLPMHLSASRIKESSEIKWKDKNAETKIEVATAHQSHAQKAMIIQDLLFGRSGNRLVRAIRSDQGMTTAGTFNGGSREITLDTIDDPNSPWFVFVSTHENTHASDPSLMNTSIYPLDVLIRVSHGMARVLNQANSIEGMFLNNQESYNVPNIKKGIGEGVGRLFLQDNLLIDQVDLAGHDLIVRTLNEIAQEQKTVVGQMKFTKKACHNLGGVLLPKILSKRIAISGSLLNDWYTPRVEGASKEIFADMVATSLMYPEKISNNEEIISGVTEMLSAIQGVDVDVHDLIEVLHIKDSDVAERYEAEQNAITQTEQQSIADGAQILDQSEVQAIQEEAQAEQYTQNKIWDFINEGIVPPDLVLDDENNIEIMKQYGHVISSVYERFPEVIYGLNADDISFDPNLHIWETWEVAEAWNADVFCNLLTNPLLISEQIDDVKRRIGVLNNFINSSAFNRPVEQSVAPAQISDMSHSDALRLRIKNILT